MSLAIPYFSWTSTSQNHNPAIITPTQASHLSLLNTIQYWPLRLNSSPYHFLPYLGEFKAHLMPENFDCQILSPLPSSIPCWVLSNSPTSKMKNKASTYMKQVFSFIVTMVKAKSMAVKNKTSAIKARLLIFGLLRNRKVLMSAINHKIHALISQEKYEIAQNEEDHNKAIVLYNNAEEEPLSTGREEEDEENDYPDLRHSLFDLEEDDEDDELVNGTESVIDLVRKSREDGADFSLEDEIDHVADVFIRRFHKQMRIQKQESFKRYKEMLARGV